MNSKFEKLLIALMLLLSLIAGTPCYAQAAEKALANASAKDLSINPECIYTHNVKKYNYEDAKALNTFLRKYLKYINSHNISGLGDSYATDFLSEDGFDKNRIVELTKQTWEKYPDIAYQMSVKTLRLGENIASVEISVSSKASTKNKSAITKDSGEVKGSSQNILYLEKYGKGWKIVSDKTLYEEFIIKYGTAKGIDISLDVPEQVFAGEEYSASIKIVPPQGKLVLGSITSTVIEYPVKKPDETFRQVEIDNGSLERVLKANKNNLNEIVSASISLCEAQRTSYSGLDLKISGTVIVLKRVNVLPLRNK